MQFDPDIDYYKKLGVAKNATQVQIKKKFYELAKKHHPDAPSSKKSDEELFKQITAAYDVLSNTDTKKQYDSARQPQQRNPNEGNQHRGSNSKSYGYQSGSQQNDQGFNQWARQEKTSRYDTNKGGFGSFGQQSYEDFKKTQKDDGQYNYFYKDATKEDWRGDSRHGYDRRGDHYQSAS